MNYTVKDKYVKVRNIDGKYFGIHLFTEEILYDPYKKYFSEKLSHFTKNRIVEDVQRAIERHKGIIGE